MCDVPSNIKEWKYITGIKMGNAMSFVASTDGVLGATRGVSEYTTNYRADFANKKVDKS